MYKAVEHSNNILSWQENLPEDEMPPEWMWSVDHELEIWFEKLKDARAEKYGTPREESPMMSNEYAQKLRQVN